LKRTRAHRVQSKRCPDAKRATNTTTLFKEIKQASGAQVTSPIPRRMISRRSEIKFSENEINTNTELPTQRPPELVELL
jgi:hypothetical protein